MKKMLLVALWCAAAAGLSAETLVYKFTPGEKYRFVTTVDERVYLDGRLSNTAHFLTKVTYDVTAVNAGSGSINAFYQVSVRRDENLASYVMEEENASSFTVSPQGVHTVPPRYLYPLTRNIPFFPKEDIKRGHVWSAPGEEMHDLRRPYGIAEPFRIPVNVRHAFLGTRIAGGRTVARIDIDYSYMTKVRGVRPAGDFYPTMISGTCRKIYDWDIAAGRLVSYEEDFDVFYHLSNGQVAEFTGRHAGTVILSRPLDTEETVRDITREIEKEKLEGVRVEGTEAGVRITLENIQFEPDSDLITPAEARKIAAIAAILKKYPDRDVRLVGHTAAVGTAESCLALSIRRAKSVGDALLELRARGPDQMTVVGKGLTEPIAPNDTEAGRIKNRRVEIYILEN